MRQSTTDFDVIIIGAGAAGLMCALTAGQRGRRVLLLERTDKAGAKILISGGGRCNFTNLGIAPDRFVSTNPHFCVSALRRYTQWDFIDLVARHRIAYHEKTLGQLFCDGSARAIVAMLLKECERGEVTLRFGQNISGVSKPDGFRVEISSGVFTAPALVLATGGLSIPKMGATGFSHDLARRFGLRVTETRPGLVPFKAKADAPGFDASLAGVSLDAIVSCGDRAFREAILFTHRGLSGPAILQISSYWRPGASIAIDLLPGLDAAGFLKERKRTRPRASGRAVLAEVLPARLAQALADAHLPSAEMANIPDRILVALAEHLKGWRFTPQESEGFAKAEVTVGGIDTRDLSSKTMESREVKGLYAIGEAVDVTGWLGGYNFQWAWSSGWCAGQAV
ncbi:membrane protein [Rhodomicrobium udaipurense JA643]|uniref:NAD(P)/FAD-dependent oxidoreductase n=1 Tax=Rhodomicrobium udaipurense TaxID=1202716 RepID=A0A8I1GEI7_9HYPH|nr:NAD(P)/FAD-dependent oxidoreductase [Rhodomicrobium udaipurense]KAI93621.1 membrane protein [Rhodomicrobium udaipurense JA643]MBJ7542326.1 NAD(P)/FAD-dependent oxidoreductase [Rhodomicrobium udaipurense]